MAPKELRGCPRSSLVCVPVRSKSCGLEVAPMKSGHCPYPWSRLLVPVAPTPKISSYVEIESLNNSYNFRHGYLCKSITFESISVNQIVLSNWTFGKSCVIVKNPWWQACIYLHACNWRLKQVYYTLFSQGNLYNFSQFLVLLFVIYDVKSGALRPFLWYQNLALWGTNQIQVSIPFR